MTFHDDAKTLAKFLVDYQHETTVRVGNLLNAALLLSGDDPAQNEDAAALVKRQQHQAALGADVFNAENLADVFIAQPDLISTIVSGYYTTMIITANAQKEAAALFDNHGGESQDIADTFGVEAQGLLPATHVLEQHTILAAKEAQWQMQKLRALETMCRQMNIRLTTDAVLNTTADTAKVQQKPAPGQRIN